MYHVYIIYTAHTAYIIHTMYTLYMPCTVMIVVTTESIMKMCSQVK